GRCMASSSRETRVRAECAESWYFGLVASLIVLSNACGGKTRDVHSGDKVTDGAADAGRPSASVPQTSLSPPVIDAGISTDTQGGADVVDPANVSCRPAIEDCATIGDRASSLG